jgi:FkbM family methyltransferase
MNIPKDFDWGFYLNFYEDLKNSGLKTKNDAINHYLNYGFKEKRIINSNYLPKKEIPKDFDWEFYLNHNHDLKMVGLKSENDAIIHFMKDGKKEKRNYKKIILDGEIDLNETQKKGNLRIKITTKVKIHEIYDEEIKNFINSLISLNFVDIFFYNIDEIELDITERQEYDYFDFNIIINSIDKNLLCDKSFKNCLFFSKNFYLDDIVTTLIKENSKLILLSCIENLKGILPDNKIYQITEKNTINNLLYFFEKETSNMIISDKLKDFFNQKNDRTEPLVTLITSVKNAYEYLDQFFENTINQTIFKQCEWIIIDVNQDDKDYSIIKKYLSYENILYERIFEDGGLYAIWNYAIKKSKSQFITNFNCDDRRFENSLECQLKTILINDSDIVFNPVIISTKPNISTHNLKDITNENNSHIAPTYKKSNLGLLSVWFCTDKIDDIIRHNIIGNCPLWKKNIHKKIGYFDEIFKSAGDWDFWIRCYFYNCKFKNIKETLGIYYHNPQGLSTDENNKKLIKKEDQIITERKKNKYQQEINKIINKKNLLKDFNWNYYLICNKDLKENGINTEEQAIDHFLNHGFYENRHYVLKQNYSQFNQDLKVIDFYKNKKNGFFVEIGASDGITLSNTFLLETLYDWKGICVEPIDSNYKKLISNRINSDCCNFAVFNETGKIVNFDVVESYDLLSGISEYLDSDKTGDMKKSIIVKTISLNDLLEKYNAPKFIEYLSLDTEGSEFEILKNFNFNNYIFGLIDVEHNFVEPKRTQIRNLLEKNNYLYLGTNEVDDMYQHKSISRI